MALPKPKQLEPADSAQFSDPSVVSTYRFRPPYPAEVYTMFAGLTFTGGGRASLKASQWRPRS